MTPLLPPVRKTAQPAEALDEWRFRPDKPEKLGLVFDQEVEDAVQAADLGLDQREPRRKGSLDGVEAQAHPLDVAAHGNEAGFHLFFQPVKFRLCRHLVAHRSHRGSDESQHVVFILVLVHRSPQIGCKKCESPQVPRWSIAGGPSQLFWSAATCRRYGTGIRTKAATSLTSRRTPYRTRY